MLPELLYARAPHGFASIDTYLLTHLLYMGPKSEAEIKKVSRAPGTRFLEGSSYQVKVHRSLRKLYECGLVTIASTKKTHGGLESKTYAVNEFGMAILLSGPTYDTVIQNAQHIAGDLYTIARANPQILPFAFGLLKQITNEEDQLFMRGYFLSFFINTLGNALVWSAEDNDKVVLYNLAVEKTLMQVRDIDRIKETDQFCTIPISPQRFFERLFIHHLFDLDQKVERGSGFQLLITILRRNNIESKDIEILRGVFEKIYHERQMDLQVNQKNLALFNQTFSTKN